MATRSRGKGRDYPPLVMAGLVMILLLAVMPSALNLPQTNPSQTLEYAPVPPEDNQTNPPVGNFSSLGLGSSRSVGGSNGQGGVPLGEAGAAARGVAKNPSTKNCVGDPPKQTEDPLAPPCVAFFEGDNGGATYHGVTRDEIRILFYIEGAFTDCVTSKGCEERPVTTYVDLDEPPKEDDNYHVRQLRLWQRHFNERYQTYGRRAHFFVYYTDGTNTVEGRRSDAVENLARIKPFAVVTYADAPDPYIEVMARRGVMNFGSFENKPASFFSRFPKIIWSYLPSIEESASMYSSWVCAQVVNRPVTFSGNAADQGKPRKFGLLSTADPAFPGLQLFAKTAKANLERCGAEIVAEATAPYAGYAADTRTAGEEATQNIAKFVQQGVTTVLWAQGYETTHANAAAQQNWRPEWVVAGDGFHEGYQTGKRQEQSVWDHAWVMTNVVRAGVTSEGICYSAQRQDPSSNHQDTNFDCGLLTYYQDLRMLFTGIQVAGPKLNPEAIDRGMHAIPAVRSQDPRVPACFYNANDYTCVKDAMVNWWDSQATAPGQSDPGCWKMVEEGRRHFAGAWPEREASAGRTGGDVCNGYAGPLLFYAGTD